MVWLRRPYAGPKRPRTRRPAKRESAAKRGYGHRWREYTIRFLQKSSGGNRPCIACVDELTEATIVDHIIPVNQDRESGSGHGSSDPVFWVPWNHQPVCRDHHMQKTQVWDSVYRDARGVLLREVELLQSQGVSDDFIRNRLIVFADIWSGGWLNLDADSPDLYEVLHAETTGVKGTWSLVVG